MSLPPLQVGDRVRQHQPRCRGRQGTTEPRLLAVTAGPNNSLELTGHAARSPRGVLRKQRGLQLSSVVRLDSETLAWRCVDLSKEQATGVPMTTGMTGAQRANCRT